MAKKVYDKTTRMKTELFEQDRERIHAKAEAIKEFRREASRLASMANKRVKRLEENGLTDTPAYKAYLETGGKFSVKGKSYNELQKEKGTLIDLGIDFEEKAFYDILKAIDIKY